MPPKRNVTKAMSKAELMSELAAKTDLPKKTVEGLFDALYDIIRRELRAKGEIGALPGLVVLKKAQKKATKAREGRNPRTGEPVQIAAKPAKTVVRASLRKQLKEMV